MMIVIGLPTASAAVKPNSRSAPVFHAVMMLSRSLAMIASSPLIHGRAQRALAEQRDQQAVAREDRERQQVAAVHDRESGNRFEIVEHHRTIRQDRGEHAGAEPAVPRHDRHRGVVQKVRDAVAEPRIESTTYESRDDDGDDRDAVTASNGSWGEHSRKTVELCRAGL